MDSANNKQKTYLVRNVGTAWKDWVKYYNTSASKVNRFVGEASGPYRTYWGIDPNYSALVPEMIWLIILKYGVQMQPLVMMPG